jgi:hypothetical protein
VSVPFERFTDLKACIEARRLWWPGAAEWSYFEAKWKPKAWKTPHRFLFLRTRVKQQHKEPIQLDLFVPHAYGYGSRSPSDFRINELGEGRSSNMTILSEGLNG